MKLSLIILPMRYNLLDELSADACALLFSARCVNHIADVYTALTSGTVKKYRVDAGISTETHDLKCYRSSAMHRQRSKQGG